MKIIFSAFFFFLSVCVTAQKRSTGITDKELKALVGNWAGTMVYTDYQDNKMQTSLQARLEIVDLADSLAFNFIFTGNDGIQSARKFFVRIYEDGYKLSFDSAQYDIVETRRRGPRITIYAEREGVDNNRSADFQEIIIIGPGILNITRGIRYGEMVDFPIRSRASFTKK